MHFAFNEKREFTTADILNGIEQIIPLSQIDPERTKQLQDWALSGRVWRWELQSALLKTQNAMHVRSMKNAFLSQKTPSITDL